MFDTATTMSDQSAFQEIGSGLPQAQVEPTGLAANDTRYGFIPIWGVTGIPATAFKTHGLPGSRFIPLRPFQIPTTNESNQIIHTTRFPSEQIIDLQKIIGERPHVEFTELALLRDEGKARMIVTSLTNSKACSKYPYELQNTCATCWLEFLQDQKTAQHLVDRFAADDEMLSAAMATRGKLAGSLRRGLEYGSRILNEALKAVDDPKSGKDSLADVDYAYLWNLHQDAPQYRTSLTNASLGAEIVKAMTQIQDARVVSPAVGESPISHEQISEMINKAVTPYSELVERLQSRLDLYEPRPNTPEQSSKKEKSNGNSKEKSAVTGTDS